LRRVVENFKVSLKRSKRSTSDTKLKLLSRKNWWAIPILQPATFVLFFISRREAPAEWVSVPVAV